MSLHQSEAPQIAKLRKVKNHHIKCDCENDSESSARRCVQKKSLEILSIRGDFRPHGDRVCDLEMLLLAEKSLLVYFYSPDKMFIFILYGLTTHKIIEHNFAFLHSPEIYISAVFGFSNFFPSSSIKFDTFDVDARAINSMPDTRAPISEMKNKPNRITSEVARNEKKLFSRFEEKSIKLVGWVGWKIGIISLP